jgi:hypothetical protein
MIPYVDAGFLLTLLVLTDGSFIAKKALHDAELPLPITALHQLQVANLIQQLKSSPASDRKRMASAAEQAWEWYFSEQIFMPEAPNWDSAFADAVHATLNQKSPAPLLLVLHVAAAKNLGATHFFSFDPRSRALASEAGMRLQPPEI